MGTLFTDVIFAMEEAEFLAKKEGCQKIIFSASRGGYLVVGKKSRAKGLLIEKVSSRLFNKYEEPITEG